MGAVCQDPPALQVVNTLRLLATPGSAASPKDVFVFAKLSIKE